MSTAQNLAGHGVDRAADKRCARGETTRATLMETAVRLFGEGGYAGTSTRAIAEAAGCNIGLIVFHFGSKQGLYDAAREAVKDSLLAVIAPVTARLRALLAAESTPDVLLEGLHGEIRGVLRALLPRGNEQEHFLLLRRSLQATDAQAKALFTEVFTPLFDVVEGILRAAAGTEAQCGRTRLATFLLVDVVIGVLRDYAAFYAGLGQPCDAQADAETLAAIIDAALRGNFTAPERT